jgi:TIR domain
MAQRIFISYRRQDSRGDAGRIYDRLRPEFGEAGLFMDVSDIRLGVNFVKVLRDEVAKCDVLLAVMGPGWLDAKDDDGSCRLDNPNDFVRVEIAAALARDIPVIPILLEGTRMPKASLLPVDLQELSQRHGLDVRHTSFRPDIDKLITALKRNYNVDTPVPPPTPPPVTSVAESIPTDSAKRATPNTNDLIILEEITMPKPSVFKPLASTLNGIWDGVPTADLVIQREGKWVDDFKIDTEDDSPPKQFWHYFIYTCSYVGDSSPQPGAIVVGEEWIAGDRWEGGASGWRVVHGNAVEGDKPCWLADIHLTYLGPIWCPEYAKLSDDVFKYLWGERLERFIMHP